MAMLIYSDPAAYTPLLFITDATITDADTLFVDSVILFVTVADPALVDGDTLNVDSLNSIRVIVDTAFVDGDTLNVDSFVRIVTDPSLADSDTLTVDALRGDVVISPYWVWRFVRQGGHLFLTPTKNGQAWAGADVVSSPFRYSSGIEAYAMSSVVDAWAANSGASTAVLKAAIDSALGLAGFKNVDGTALS